MSTFIRLMASALPTRMPTMATITVIGWRSAKAMGFMQHSSTVSSSVAADVVNELSRSLLTRRLGRELIELVDAQLLLDGRDLLHGLLESLLAEQTLFFLFELLAQLLDLLGRHDL